MDCMMLPHSLCKMGRRLDSMEGKSLCPANISDERWDGVELPTELAPTG